MCRLTIEHVTTYHFAETLTLLPRKLLLCPREGHAIRIGSATPTISPAHQLQSQRDVYDKPVSLATFSEPGNELSIDNRLILQRYDDHPLNFLVAVHAVFFPLQYDAAERVAAAILDIRPSHGNLSIAGFDQQSDRDRIHRINSARNRASKHRPQPIPGRKSTCPAQAGKCSTPHPARWSAMTTSRSPWGVIPNRCLPYQARF